MKIKKKKIPIFFKSFFLIILFLSNGKIIWAHSVPPAPRSIPLDNIFKIPNGAHSYVDKDLVIITENTKHRIGSIFSTEVNKMDLTKDFESEMYVYMKGDADGVTFAMHNDYDRTMSGGGYSGEGLGVYATLNSNIVERNKALRSSFIVEFDTYFNGGTFDKGLINTPRGHVAWSFPDKFSSYTQSVGQIKTVNHYDVQYPKIKLGDGTWQKFNIKWETYNENNTGFLTYDYEKLEKPIRVPITRDTFGSDKIYWGFTGSTGNEFEEAAIAFKQVPGLVDYDTTFNAKNEQGEILTESSKMKPESEVTLDYTGVYTGGLQGLLNPEVFFELPEGTSYQKGSFKVNGNVENPSISGKKLSISLDTMTEVNSQNNITFKVKNDMLTSTNSPSSITASVEGRNFISKDYFAKYQVDFGPLVTSSFFENQSWIINAINKQFSPLLSIDKNLYEWHLGKVSELLVNGAYRNEYIPRNIKALTNIEKLNLVDMGLIGNIPSEIVNLTKLKELVLNGMNYEGETIPPILSELDSLEILNLAANKYSGQIDPKLAGIPNLKRLDISLNNLVGVLPDLPETWEQINLAGNQITYNDSKIPSFLVNQNSGNYAQTFIAGEKYYTLVGNSKMDIKEELTTIQPFNPINKGFFALKIYDQVLNKEIELTEGHMVQISNAKDGTLFYEGPIKGMVEIPYKKGVSYKLILDGAEKNKNNLFQVKTKLPELKFSEIPEDVKLNLTIGKDEMVPKKIEINGPLAVYDNRDNGSKWVLKIVPSKLINREKLLRGEFIYTDSKGKSVPLMYDQSASIEAGASDGINDVTSVTDRWKDAKIGIHFEMQHANYLGSYEGTIKWLLEDAP